MIYQKFIISGTYDEYNNYLREKQLDKREWVYVYDKDILRGRKEVHGKFIGTYTTRKDLQEIVDTIRMINNIPSSVCVLPQEAQAISDYISFNATVPVSATQKYGTAVTNAASSSSVGFAAQEVQKILPEIVKQLSIETPGIDPVAMTYLKEVLGLATSHTAVDAEDVVSYASNWSKRDEY